MAQQTNRLELFSGWLTALGDAWEAADADAMAALFVVAATFQPTPFADLLRGRREIRDHFADVVAGLEQISFRAEVLGAGETYGVAHWRTAGMIAVLPGAPVSRVRDGIMVCAIDGRGRCTSLRQWWHETEEPPQAALN